MAYEHHRSSLPPRYLVHFAKAFLLKLGIADRQHLVDNQNFRLQMRGNGKCKSNVHAGGVPLDGRIEKPFHVGEGDDFIELPPDLALLHPQDRAVEEDVLAAGQFLVESRSDFQKARHAPLKLDSSLRRFGDSAQYFEKRALASAVA